MYKTCWDDNRLKHVTCFIYNLFNSRVNMSGCNSIELWYLFNELENMWKEYVVA